MKKNIILCLSAILLCATIHAQDTTATDELPANYTTKGFKFGITVGVYWANKYTASLYDGYGLDYQGHRNEFSNSLIYNKIWNEYGGHYNSGQIDQIAQALNVDPNTWTFKESDMPVNMKYTPAFQIGLNARYGVDDKNAIILNVNACKLIINGNFTIVTTVQSNQNQLNAGVHTYPIKGGEQRMMFQFGYSRILGDNPRLNFLLEGGLDATLAKYDKNLIEINTLLIDLTSSYQQTGQYYNTGQPGYTTLNSKHLRGIGFGAFASAGIHITMSPKWTLQLAYNPTYEKISIGLAPKLKLQHAVGIRMYYNF